MSQCDDGVLWQVRLGVSTFTTERVEAAKLELSKRCQRAGVAAHMIP